MKFLLASDRSFPQYINNIKSDSDNFYCPSGLPKFYITWSRKQKQLQWLFGIPLQFSDESRLSKINCFRMDSRIWAKLYSLLTCLNWPDLGRDGYGIDQKEMHGLRNPNATESGKWFPIANKYCKDWAWSFFIECWKETRKGDSDILLHPTVILKKMLSFHFTDNRYRSKLSPQVNHQFEKIDNYLRQWWVKLSTELF